MKFKYGLYVDNRIVISVMFPEFVHCTVVMQENILVFKRGGGEMKRAQRVTVA